MSQCFPCPLSNVTAHGAGDIGRTQHHFSALWQKHAWKTNDQRRRAMNVPYFILHNR